MKTLNILIFLLISLGIQSQTLKIDTLVNHVDTTIIKSYDYGKYYIDSMWINSKLQLPISTNKDINRLFLDSLFSTETYKTRKQLPNSEVPEEFYIFSDIYGGDYGIDYDRVFLYFNKSKKMQLIAYQNRYSCKNVTGKEFCYKLISLDSIMPLIEKLNRLILWDKQSSYSKDYSDCLYLGNMHGSIELEFKFASETYKNSIPGTLGCTYGIFIELYKLIESKIVYDKLNVSTSFDNFINDISRSNLIKENGRLIRFLNEIK